MPRTIRTEKEIDIPAGVTVKVDARKVQVTGPRGTLNKNFSHLNATIKTDGKRVMIERWFGSKKEIACIRTVLSHINNMIKGVTKGFRYKMRFVYAHFPVNAAITNKDTTIELRNFLGEKVVRRVDMKEGVTIARSEKVKDEIVLTGNDIQRVAESAASIHMCTLIRNKDIRKFLDGIYVSEAGVIKDE
jgi:large subunit ribosomal protein L9e